MLLNAYQSIFDLVSNAIFGGNPAIATYGTFFCEAFSIIACGALLVLPFLIIWRIIRRFL
ncbi:MAG: hypothetical protein ACI4MB_00370 [Candidatus Coproplasma sp.]